MSFPGETGPSGREPADAGRAMRARQGSNERAARGEPACERPDLAARLCEWPELPTAERAALEAHALACRECGAGLALLRETEAWFEEQVPAPSASLCPSPEELYDYGRGPGARPLPEVERVALRAHLAGCRDCSALVETLASRPPAPLLDLPSAAASALPAAREPAPAAAPVSAPAHRAPTRLRLLAPLATAAAAALALAVLWPDTRPAPSGTLRFPAAPLLRGDETDALLFPRDALLVDESRPWQPLRFELAPRERASSYRVVLRATDGSAFDAGREVLRLESAQPELAAAADIALPAGHYTWEASAQVDGLFVELGRRDFEARREPSLIGELSERERASEPARSEAILHLLHERGYLGDARAFARTLPESPERDAYLARRPGR